MNTWLTSDEVYSVNQCRWVPLRELTAFDVIEIGDQHYQIASLFWSKNEHGFFRSVIRLKQVDLDSTTLKFCNFGFCSPTLNEAARACFMGFFYYVLNQSIPNVNGLTLKAWLRWEGEIYHFETEDEARQFIEEHV